MGDPQEFLTAILGMGAEDWQATRALAIAYAESNLRVDAVTPEPDGSTSYGVLQINSVHLKSGGMLSGFTTGQLLTMGGNVLAGQRVSNYWQKWTPWTTFNTNAYLMWMNKANSDLDTWKGKNKSGYEKAQDSVTGALGSVPDAIGSVSSGVSSLVDAVRQPQTWLRVAYVAAGIGMVWVGLAIVARPVVTPIASTLSKVPIPV